MLKNGQKTKHTYAIYDILKFVLALGVVAIHTRFMQYYLYPWLRVSVPLFFLMSAYFLFEKMSCYKQDNVRQREIIMNFVKRNLQLYGFWFVVLLPGTLRIRQYFSQGIVRGIITFVRTFLFDSTFVASWFIMATVIAVLIVYFASKRMSNKTMLLVSMVIYILTALRSSYYSELQNVTWISTLVSGYESIFYPGYNSFPAALYWVVCGKCFAENEIRFSMKASVIITIISGALLYAEWSFVKLLNGTYNNDCYICLIPFCTFLFSVAKQIRPFQLKGTIWLRKASVIMFALHGTLVSLGITWNLFFLVDFLNISSESKNFIVTVFVCLGASFVIMLLEKTKWFSWLKYSH